MVNIIPAIMPNSAAHLDEMVQTVAAFAYMAQIDVMDGTFSLAVSWPYGSGQMKELERMRMIPGAAQIAYGVHLMVGKPEDIGILFAHRGVRRIVGHIESLGHANDARRTCAIWRKEGVQTGVSLLIDTPLEEITSLIENNDVDVVQVMGIAEIGYQGHPFDERAIERVRELRDRYPHLHISVDGGVSRERAHALAEAGADMLVVGSAIIKSEEPQKAYAELERIVAEA